ncbi:MAG: efflux RND transporter periplasmic adaptor subunit [Saprospiraceae bacterium]|nr:efflux RND transporter periplasmic adaptor subunit [Saprospiraceae bacterium]
MYIRYYVLGGVFLLGLLFSSCGNSSPEEVAVGASSDAAAVVALDSAQLKMAGVETGQARLRRMAELVGSRGRVEAPPQSIASVYAPMSGFVRWIRHYPGDYVRKGTVLTELSHPDLVKLQGDFLESQSKLSFLRKDYARKSELAGEEAASQRSLDLAKAELEIEATRMKSLGAQLAQLGVDTANLAASRNIQSAIPIRAPLDGYLTALEVNLGKLVHPDDLLFEIVDNRHLHLELQVYAQDLPILASGQAIACTAPGRNDTLWAKVHQIGKSIDPESRTTMVHGHFDHEPVPLIPGTYLSAWVYTGEEEVWVVPQEAVVQEDGRSYVFERKASGFVRREVTTGLAQEGLIALVDWPANDDLTLAVKGAYYLNGHLGELSGE